MWNGQEAGVPSQGGSHGVWMLVVGPFAMKQESMIHIFKRSPCLLNCRFRGKSGSQSAGLKVAVGIQARGGASWQSAVAGGGGGRQTEGFYGGRTAGSVVDSPADIREKEVLGLLLSVPEQPRAWQWC